MRNRRLVNPFEKCMVKNFQDFECIQRDSWRKIYRDDFVAAVVVLN